MPSRPEWGGRADHNLEIVDGGKTIFLVTDSAGGVLNAAGEGVSELENPGAILVYTAK